MIIRDANIADAPALAELGAATFIETFGSLYRSEDLESFVGRFHTEAAHERALRDPDIGVWLATDERGHAIGYAVAGPCKLPVQNLERRAGELWQVYVRASHQGQQLGSRLVARALDWLDDGGFAPLYIGVWSQNVAAQRLYGRYGFEKVAEYGFRVGEQIDHEFIMKRSGARPSSAKPHSIACERNRDPILAVLSEHFADRRRVLEVGSGTGQHAVHFAAALPHLVWQTSDVAENHPGIRAWLSEAGLRNTPAPLVLDVREEWPDVAFDAVFSANTLHIMSWAEVRQFFASLAQAAPEDLTLAIYGPFNYGGRYTSESNAAFDASLKSRGAHMGIRDFEAVDALAGSIGLRLLADRAMPANNRTLVWRHEGERKRFDGGSL